MLHLLLDLARSRACDVEEEEGGSAKSAFQRTSCTARGRRLIYHGLQWACKWAENLSMKCGVATTARFTNEVLMSHAITALTPRHRTRLAHLVV